MSVGEVFAVIAEPENVEGVSYYLLRCTTERMKLTKPKESDGMLLPTGIFFKFIYLNYVHLLLNDEFIYYMYTLFKLTFKFAHDLCRFSCFGGNIS